jgi:hypothetical protein
MHFRAWLLALALLAVPLTGCLGLTGDDDSSGGDDVQQTAQVTSTTGGIEGLVTNAAVEPIEGAEVSIPALGESTTTSEDGSFAFSELAPGTHTVAFESEGFLSTEQDVDVAAEEVATVDVVMTREPGQNPYMTQRKFTGFVECSANAVVVAVAACAIPNAFGGNVTNDRFTFQFPVEPDPWQMTTEVKWETSTPLGARNSMNIEPAGLPNDNKTEFGSLVGESPLIHQTDRERFAEVDKNTTAVCDEEKDPESAISASRDAYCNRNYIEEGGEVYVRMFVASSDPTGTGVPGPGVAFQQEYDLVVTTFHYAPACDDFSVFEDNKCEQPETPPETDPADQVEG